MQHCGLLAQEREGRKTYYRVCEPCLKDFLACIRKRFTR
jgi:DNA-binding transcriptional regulator PaaX